MRFTCEAKTNGLLVEARTTVGRSTKLKLLLLGRQKPSLERVRTSSKAYFTGQSRGWGKKGLYESETKGVIPDDVVRTTDNYRRYGNEEHD